MVAAGSRLAGRYRVERLIAHGGMASVYAARDETLDRAVAVKVLRPGEPVDRTRFDREARVLAGLAHPNLLAVYDIGEEDDALFMVLELIEGPTLAARLADGQPLPADEMRRIGAELAGALACVHEQEIVHRDVKPSNVLFDGRGRARLGDFGIALLADTTALTAPDSAIGTAAYMAPEQIEGRPAVASADIYALGLVLLEGLTGRRVYPGPAPAAALARLAHDPEIPDTLPPSWSALLTAMTAREPARRPGATTVASALAADGDRAGPSGTPTELLAATAALAAPPSAAAPPGPGAPDRSRVGWAAVAAVVALLLGAIVLNGRDDPGPTDGAEQAVSSTETPATTAAPTTAASPTSSPTVAPPTVVPAVDCGALEAEKEALEERKREIDEEYRDDHETRDRLLDEIKDRTREIDDQLRDSCR